MNNYYLTLVLKDGLDDNARVGLFEMVKKRMLGKDGKVEKEDLWGVRDLAYPIKRQSKGFYAHFEFSTDPSLAKDLDKILKVEEDVLRYLLVRV